MNYELRITNEKNGTPGYDRMQVARCPHQNRSQIRRFLYWSQSVGKVWWN